MILGALGQGNMSLILENKTFKKGNNYAMYGVFFIAMCVVSLLSTILIPWNYDQSNLLLYEDAVKNNELMVREYANIEINSQIEKLKHENGGFPLTSEQKLRMTDTLQNKKLISLDYIHQMKRAEQLVRKEFLWFTVSITLFFCIFLAIDFYSLRSHAFRTPIIFVIFLSALIVFWVRGLPHVNYKFHIIIGLIFAIILAASDFLHTYNIWSNNSDSSVGGESGKLSALQYKHRFWCVILNSVIVTMLTTFGTISFKTLDFFYQVFGESFVTRPLLGLACALFIVLFLVIIGILNPIRKNLADIEIKMEKLGILDAAYRIQQDPVIDVKIT